MARRTKEDAQATRRAILEAAVRCFSTQGVTHATLADIAREAGLTRGAIYWHFANKADLINALRDRVASLYAPLMQAGINKDEPDPLGRMRELYVSVYNDLADDPRQRRLFQILLDVEMSGKDDEAIREYHASLHRKVREEIQTVLRNAVARRQLAPDFDVRLGAVAVLSFTHGLMYRWIQSPDFFDMKKDPLPLLDSLIGMLRSGALRRGKEGGL